MTLALDRPGPAAVLTHWTLQPLALVVVLALAVGYGLGVRRLARPWPRGRIVTFGVGLGLLLWSTCGFLGAYASSLYWVWTTQTLVLWLGVPIILLWGHPIQLARAVGGPYGRVDRVLRSRPLQLLGNPLVGPALVPILSGVLFFGPVPGWAIAWPPVGWLLQVALLVIGAAMVLPLVGLDDNASSLAVGLSLGLGSFELVMDALPGVVLRLHRTLATSWFAQRDLHAWTPGALHDQQVAGAILWCVAELIDLPFLALVFRRWLRADARDAAEVDAVLEAERHARRGLPARTVGGDAGAAGQAPVAADAADDDTRDVPWWVSDPAMQQRLRRLD